MNGMGQRGPDHWVGQKLGKYRIESVLGHGQQGVVLRAHDPSMDRHVAVRVLSAKLSDDELTRSRFLIGAKSAGKSSHVNIVTVYEVAQDETVSYLAMELVTGGSARDHLDYHGPFDVGEATRIVIEASRGLAAAHEAGFVHRDIKPSNLLITEDGTVKVSDFQLAKQTSVATVGNLTLAGQLIGTPHYMSPEQCQAGKVDARSDIYSLGATYFTLLTGRRPYDERPVETDVMLAHIQADPPDPREIRPELPDACAQLIEQAMATDPNQRYQSMDELRVDLEAVSEALLWGYA